MRYSETTHPAKPTPGLSENNIDTLISIMSSLDGVIYVSATPLRFSRPAICLTGKNGEQKTIAVENAKQIIKEISHE